MVIPKPVWISFYSWTQKMLFWTMLATKQFRFPSDFHSILWLYDQQMKEIHTGLGKLGEQMMTVLMFEWTAPLKHHPLNNSVYSDVVWGVQ